jgi:hypothetical protein
MNIRNAVALTIVTAGFMVAVIVDDFVLQHDSVDDCQRFRPWPRRVWCWLSAASASGRCGVA